MYFACFLLFPFIPGAIISLPSQRNKQPPVGESKALEELQSQSMWSSAEVSGWGPTRTPTCDGQLTWQVRAAVEPSGLQLPFCGFWALVSPFYLFNGFDSSESQSNYSNAKIHVHTAVCDV